LGYSGKWLKAAENSVADEMVLADPFFTPDAYLNPKSYPTKIMFSEVTTTSVLFSTRRSDIVSNHLPSQTM
jgi:hypothetical protein